MLALKQFRALAEAYGADFSRWPEGVREHAAMLHDSCSEAREILSEARMVDESIKSASCQEDKELRILMDQDDALARLRSNVAKRISMSPQERSSSFESIEAFFAQISRTIMLHPGRFAIAGSACVAILTGFLVGSSYLTGISPDTGGLLANLQPGPLEILAD